MFAISHINKLSVNQIFIFGLLFRLSIFIILAIWPFNHIYEGNFGPFSYQNADRMDYLFTLDLLLLEKESIETFLNNYLKILSLDFNFRIQNQNTITGPLFPLILGLTNYSLETPYFLSILCFLSEIVCFYIWINFYNNKIKKIYIFLFAFLPIPLMFGLIHSTDIFFYLMSTVVIIRIILYEKIDFIIITLLFLSAMLRPASLALLVSVYLYFSLFSRNKLPGRINFILFSILLFSIIYYLPYFIDEINKEKVQYPFYFENIFILQYEIVNNETIKFFVIFLLKFFFLFGFDPSESGYPVIQIIRSFIGAIFLIGFIKTFIYRKIKIEFIYIWITVFFTALLFYPTYRYIVPIMPFLYMYFFSRSFKIS